MSKPLTQHTWALEPESGAANKPSRSNPAVTWRTPPQLVLSPVQVWSSPSLSWSSRAGVQSSPTEPGLTLMEPSPDLVKPPGFRPNLSGTCQTQPKSSGARASSGRTPPSIGALVFLGLPLPRRLLVGSTFAYSERCVCAGRVPATEAGRGDRDRRTRAGLVMVAPCARFISERVPLCVFRDVLRIAADPEDRAAGANPRTR